MRTSFSAHLIEEAGDDVRAYAPSVFALEDERVRRRVAAALIARENLQAARRSSCAPLGPQTLTEAPGARTTLCGIV